MKIKRAKDYLIEKWPERFAKTGLTQEQFADKVGIARQSWNKIVSGDRKNLRATTIDSVEKVFKELRV